MKPRVPHEPVNTARVAGQLGCGLLLLTAFVVARFLFGGGKP